MRVYDAVNCDTEDPHDARHEQMFNNNNLEFRPKIIQIHFIQTLPLGD